MVTRMLPWRYSDWFLRRASPYGGPSEFLTMHVRASFVHRLEARVAEIHVRVEVDDEPSGERVAMARLEMPYIPRATVDEERAMRLGAAEEIMHRSHLRVVDCGRSLGAMILGWSEEDRALACALHDDCFEEPRLGVECLRASPPGIG